jgi:hypothetical protein
MTTESMKHRCLEQVAEAGKRGVLVDPGWESVTQNVLVEEGLLWQEIEGGKYKFTLSSAGERALNLKVGEKP